MTCEHGYSDENQCHQCHLEAHRLYEATPSFQCFHGNLFWECLSCTRDAVQEEIDSYYKGWATLVTKRKPLDREAADRRLFLLEQESSDEPPK